MRASAETLPRPPQDMTTKETAEDKILRGLDLFYAENRVLDKLPPRPTTTRFSSIDYDGFSYWATWGRRLCGFCILRFRSWNTSCR
jgi:hypothetical protein